MQKGDEVTIIRATLYRVKRFICIFLVELISIMLHSVNCINCYFYKKYAGCTKTINYSAIFYFCSFIQPVQCISMYCMSKLA